jgi:hypothetical protein
MYDTKKYIQVIVSNNFSPVGSQKQHMYLQINELSLQDEVW